MDFALPGQATNRNHETVIVGLGRTGLSVATYLCKQGVPFVMLDTRHNPPYFNLVKQEFPDVEICLGKLSTDSFQNAKRIIVSPGVAVDNEFISCAVMQGAEYCGDIELFVNNTQVPIVAVTGSNGKSTVTSLVVEMARAADIRAYAGGNLGPPALDLLAFDDAELFVLELSSFQLESTWSLRPQVGVVLNLSSDHLDRHGSVGNYAHIKAQVYEHANFSVVNRNDTFVANMKTSGVVISFGSDSPARGEFGLIHDLENVYLAKGKNPLLVTSELAMQGEAGVLNALAALAIGDALGLSLEKMLLTLANFKGLPHRFSLVGKSQGVSWFNDSKGTNIGASICALRSLEADIILLAGGVFKGGDLSLLHEVVAKHVKHVVLFGQDAGLLKQALHGAASVCSVNTIRDAVTIARGLSRPGDKVLLSPACASFDMYEDFIARGEDFEACVKELVL